MLKWPARLLNEAGGEAQRCGVRVPVCVYNTCMWPRTVDTQNTNSDFAVAVGTGDFFPSSNLVDTTLDLLSKCIIKLGREKGAVRLPRLWLTVTLSHNKAGKLWNYLGAQPSYNPQVTCGETDFWRKWLAQTHKARLEATFSASSFLQEVEVGYWNLLKTRNKADKLSLVLQSNGAQTGLDGTGPRPCHLRPTSSSPSLSATGALSPCCPGGSALQSRIGILQGTSGINCKP